VLCEYRIPSHSTIPSFLNLFSISSMWMPIIA
jgi:hypothetical protein